MTIELSETLVMAGFMLIMIGVALIFIGFLHMAFSGPKAAEKGESKVEAGGVIMIGPIPIAFGTSSKALLYAMILAVIVMLLAIALMFYSRSLVVPH